MYFVAPIRPATSAALNLLPAAYIHLSTNEKRRYVMTSGFRQYIAGYTVENLGRYPIRLRVAFASALELRITISLEFYYINQSIFRCLPLNLATTSVVT